MDEPRFEHDVFLSFASADQDAASAIWRQLTRGGLRVFWSAENLKDRAGASFFDELDQALRGSQHFALLWTRRSRKSEWVKQEYESFFNNCHLKSGGARRIFILTDGSEPTSSLPIFFQNFQLTRSAEVLASQLGARRGDGPALADAVQAPRPDAPSVPRTTASPAPTPLPNTPVQRTRQGISPLSWLGIGCLATVLLLLGTCAYLAQRISRQAETDRLAQVIEFVVKLDPNIELVTLDKASQRVTLRDKKSGHEYERSFEAIRNGELWPSPPPASPQSEGNIGSLPSWSPPDWMPRYPGAATTGSFAVAAPSTDGMAMFETPDGVESVLGYFARSLEAKGFAVEVHSYPKDGQVASGTVTAKSAPGKGDVAILAGLQDGKTLITVTYTQGSDSRP